MPSMMMCPDVRGMRPAMSLRMVDFPQPLGPMSAMKSPHAALKLTRSRISGPAPKRFSTISNVTTGGC
jgi:hypothetical protein